MGMSAAAMSSKRNAEAAAERFPEDFMFQLTARELAS
jgi:hypothetical protein